jgi:hypothetical protein
MSAATGRVASTTTNFDNAEVYRKLSVASGATYYLGGLVALNASGHAVKCTDTAGLRFDGVATGFTGGHTELEVAATDVLGVKKVRVKRPPTFGIKIASASDSDIGSPVYALYDNEVALTGVTNYIQVGWIDEVVSSTFVMVRPVWLGAPGEADFDGNTLTFDGANTVNNLVVPDNLADALSVKISGGADLFVVTTTDSGEKVTFSTKVVMSGANDLLFSGTTGQCQIQLTDNLADALSIGESTNDYLVFVTTNSGEKIQVKQALEFPGATGTNLIKLTDNLASALDVTEASNSYLKFVTTNSAEAVVFGKAITQAVGASTAAAGSTNADAGALPSATAYVYPTTAADGTKGVIISTADKVDGRVFFVGNGVSNQVLKIYPPSGGTINGAAANAAFSTASGKGALLVCLSASGNTWLAM